MKSKALLVRAAMTFCFAATLSAAAHAQDVLPHAPFLAAPATAWATPLDGGPIRVSFVVARDAGREVGAILERAEIRDSLHVYGDDAAEFHDAMAASLRGKFDVLVVSYPRWDSLDENEIGSLRESVSDGRGVVLVGYGETAGRAIGEALQVTPDSVDLLRGIGQEAMQSALVANAVSAYAGAEGRVVSIRHASTRATGECVTSTASGAISENATLYENHLSLVLRCIRWAAHREPRTTIASIQAMPDPAPSASEIPPQLTPAFVDRMQQSLNPELLRGFVLTLTAPADRTYRLRFWFRYPGRGVQWGFDAEEIVPKGAKTVELFLPSGSGEYFLDAWLLDREDVVDWYTEAISTPGRPRIGDVRFSPGVIDPNDRVRVSLSVEGGSRSLVSTVTGASAPGNGATIIARMVDAYGRVGALKSQRVTADGGEVGIDLPIADWAGPYGRAEVFVTDGFDENASWWLRQTASYAAADLYVRQPPPSGLELIAEVPGDAGYWSRTLRQRLMDAGVQRVVTEGDVPDPLLAADGLRAAVRLPAMDGLLASPQSAGRETAEDRLRLIGMGHAALRPGLYWIDPPDGGPESSLEESRNLELYRSTVQSILRESDPAAIVGVRGARFTGAARIAAPDALSLALRPRSRVDYTAIRTEIPRDDAAEAYAQWLPWFAAMHGADAIWLAGLDLDDVDAQAAEAPFHEFTRALGHVRAGYDALFRIAQPGARRVVVVADLDAKPDSRLSEAIQSLELRGIPFDVVPESLLDSAYLGQYATAVTIPGDLESDTARDWVSAFTSAGGRVVTEISDEDWPGIGGLELPKDFRGVARDVRVGAARVVAVLHGVDAGTKSKSVKFETDKDLHLYTPVDDLDTPTRKAFARLAPGQAAVFTTLPYEMTRVVIETPSRVTAGQRLEILATVKTRGALPGLHLLHVRIVDPNGRTLQLYGRTLIARDGLAGTYIPLAHNEIPGVYKVVVRDVLTGVEATAEVEVV